METPLPIVFLRHGVAIEFQNGIIYKVPPGTLVELRPHEFLREYLTKKDFRDLELGIFRDMPVPPFPYPGKGKVSIEIIGTGIIAEVDAFVLNQSI